MAARTHWGHNDMHIDDQTAKGMLASITDPQLREQYGNILSGDFPYRVYCASPATKVHRVGQLIGYLTKQLKAIDEPTFNKAGEPISGIETSRDRLDGRKGFKCYCGNYSIQSIEEQAVFGSRSHPAPPTKQELSDIFEKVKAAGKTPGIPFVNGEAEYDGFVIKETTR